MQVSTYQPTFIISQDANRFGGDQENYLKETNLIIEATATKIYECRTNKGDCKKLFFELIEELSNKRATLANRHQTKDGRSFGFRRDRYYPGRTSMLVLARIYEKCNQELLNFFAKHLSKMQESSGNFTKKPYHLEDSFLGRKTTLDIEVFDVNDQRYNDLPEKYYPTSMPVKKVEEVNQKPHPSTVDPAFQEIRQQFLQFKQNSPETYRCWRIASVLTNLNRPDHCPTPTTLGESMQVIKKKYCTSDIAQIVGNMRTRYVHVVQRTEMDGKLYAMTQYITWLYEDEEWLANKDPSHDPLSRMQKNSKVTLLHQDEFLIEKTLEEIAKIFEKVVLWNPSTDSLQDLKNNMALLLFLATHDIRDVRGTAAENEWLEVAIYKALEKALGLTFKIDQNRMVDLDAFAHPLLSDFVKTYAERVTLEMKN